MDCLQHAFHLCFMKWTFTTNFSSYAGHCVFVIIYYPIQQLVHVDCTNFLTTLFEVKCVPIVLIK